MGKLKKVGRQARGVLKFPHIGCEVLNSLLASNLETFISAMDYVQLPPTRAPCPSLHNYNVYTNSGFSLSVRSSHLKDTGKHSQPQRFTHITTTYPLSNENPKNRVRGEEGGGFQESERNKKRGGAQVDILLILQLGILRTPPHSLLDTILAPTPPPYEDQITEAEGITDDDDDLGWDVAGFVFWSEGLWTCTKSTKAYQSGGFIF